ncbi:MAG TPA: Gfo/Idh/MocA family oxidoreductase [Bryobacteraceae bacterium]|nr:Gfo/Idh/MocA family oxidoreductase [Bryobacteraceae bacterium]
MLRWLVIGVGDITTKRVLPAILDEPRSRLVGIVTRDPKKAEPYGVPGWTALDDALSKTGADAVYVATPVFLHAPQTIACLRAGKHVLCEKPMALHYSEACSMQRAAEEIGRTLGIAYYRRMYPKVNRAKELMADGAIGHPVFAEATSHDWFHPDDGLRDWLLDPTRAGGGPLYDIASHRIDLMNYLFGQPQRATGQLSALVHPGEVEDNATAIIEYESGVRAIVDVRWHSRVPRDEFRIRGTEGEIDLTPLNGPALVYPGAEEYLPAHQNLHYPCIENFVGAVLENGPLRSTAATALVTDWVTEQVMAANHRH